ncbi:unnamed protein product [Gadus morhua 'NCC']
MHRAFSFPITVERSRTKDRLEASLAGICELELRKQRQECLVLGALALGDSMPQNSYKSDMACFSNWGQENLTLRRQLSALQNSPWGLMQALEKQVGELRIDPNNESYEAALGDAGDSRPSSGFYESSEGHSPKETFEPTDPGSTWAYSSERPKSLGDALMLSADDGQDSPAARTSLPRSFSAPYPPLEGIAEEGSSEEPWQWESRQAAGQQPSPEEERRVSEEDYRRALRVEGYILGLIQQHTLSPPRPCQPRTTLNPDLLYGQHRRTPSHTPERRLLDPRADLSPNPESQAWGGDLLPGEAPSLEEDCYLALPYPRPRPLSLAGGLPPPQLPTLRPSCGAGTLDLCYRPDSPSHSPSPRSPSHYSQELVCAQYIPGQGCHAPLHSPSHYAPGQLKSGLLITSPDRPRQPAKPRGSKKSHDNDGQASRKGSTKASRSLSENSLLGQQGPPERRYSTTERPQGRKDPALQQAQGSGPGTAGTGRRWCSNLELSQDEGETQTKAGPGHRRPTRRARQAPPAAQPQPRAQHHHHQHQRSHSALPQPPDCPERAPICRGEGGSAARAAPGESESSMSEVYSRASSSLSSDSDEGGLVWPQQLPPRLAPSSSSSSSSPQASADTASASAQPKAFVKIKASHALKKKILRFRSGSLKVMTTV